MAGRPGRGGRKGASGRPKVLTEAVLLRCYVERELLDGLKAEATVNNVALAVVVRRALHYFMTGEVL